MIGGTIALDIDGVLADFTYPFSDLAADLYPDRMTPRAVGSQPTWHFEELSEAEQARVWEAVDATGGEFWRALPPLFTPGELEAMHVAELRGFRFVYVTARHSKAEGPTHDWLQAHRLPAGPLYMTGRKAGLLRGLPWLRGMLDDSPQGVEAMARAGLPVYVRDWPYNRALEREAPRVGSLGEYLAAVTR